MDVKTQDLGPVRGTWELAERPAIPFHITLPFSERRALLTVGDTLVVNGAVLAALYLWAWVGGGAFGFEFVQPRWFWFPLLTALWWLLAHLGDLYDVSLAGQRLEITQRIGWVGLSHLTVYLVAYFVLPRDTLPGLFFPFFMGITLIGVLAWRWIYATVFTLPPFRRRVLIAGAGWAGRTMAQALAGHGSADYHVVGFVDDDPEKQRMTVAGLPVLGGSRDLLTLVRAHRVDEVVVAITHRMRGELFQALMDCRAAGVHVTRMPALYEQLTRRVPVEHVEQGWVIEAMNDLPTLHRPAQWTKRLLDIALGLVGALIFLSLLPFLALAITLDCPGPIFYRQVRLGLGRKTYRMLKLRTMIPNAEEDGWAQIHYGYGNSVQGALIKLQYDLYYIRRWSLWLDLYVIFRTIGVVLRCRGT